MTFENIKQIVQAMELPEDIVHKMLEKALLAGYKKEYGKDYDNMVFRISEDGKKAEILAIKEVVEEVKDSVLEISLENAKKYKDNPKIGDKVEVPVLPSKFSRHAIDVIRNVLLSQKAEIERDKVNSIFKAKVGDIFLCKISNMKGRNIDLIIDFGNFKIDGFIPYEHLMPEDHKLFKVGDTIKAVLIDIFNPQDKQESNRKINRDAKLILSRTVPEFVKKLFHNNIPEVSKGIVEVKAVGRIPGERSKVAVYSVFPDVDPVGACIGVGGSRIMSVSKEISGEKIDVVLWSPDTQEFAKNVFGRSSVHSVEERQNEILIRIYESYLYVLGKNSINVKIFSQMVGKDVKVMLVEEKTSQKPEIFIEEEEVNENTYVDYLPFDKDILDKIKSKNIKTIGMLLERMEDLKSLGFSSREISHINKIVNEYIEVEVEEE
ncbi:MAG: transcription termination factor NusA [Spirochaetia bacterium]|nr:transcription termination factor NusA [Spirochaetota bacterium]MCX8096759.1 transcription termination factor NusA [Spirochaetota bacterium]MDW8112533.1 transcription termination factor NusA [Spirochaetia bacterium]